MKDQLSPDLYRSLLTSPSLAPIAIQYMHCFIKIKNCTGQFAYIIFHILFCYLLNIINRRCKKVSAWWWQRRWWRWFLPSMTFPPANCKLFFCPPVFAPGKCFRVCFYFHVWIVWFQEKKDWFLLLLFFFCLIGLTEHWVKPPPPHTPR